MILKKSFNIIWFIYIVLNKTNETNRNKLFFDFIHDLVSTGTTNTKNQFNTTIEDHLNTFYNIYNILFLRKLSKAYRVKNFFSKNLKLTNKF